jgi:hypothetical protein
VNSQYLDFETTGGAVYVGVSVTDAYGNYYSEYLDITLNDVDNNDQPPTDIAIDSDVVTEHTAIGTVVGTLFATDPDEDDTFTFAIVDSFYGSFAVEGDSLVVIDNQYLDYEWWGGDSIYVGVSVTDSYGNVYQESLNLTLLDSTNEGPTNVYLGNSTVAENAPAGTVVGFLQTTDEDSNIGFVYALVSGPGSTDNDQFVIDGSTVKTQAVFDYETKNVYSIRVRVTDPTGLTTEKPLTINVSDEGEAPTDIGLSSSDIAENLNPGATVGTFSTTDPDIGDSFTYSLVAGGGSTDNSAFTIATGGILKAAIKFNYEVKNTYSIRVRAIDAYGLPVERIFAINVTNNNEAPTALSLSPSAVDENLASGATVGNFSTTDPDAGDTFVYTLVSGSGDADNGTFEIVGDELRTLASFNFEAKSSYSIRVQTTDPGGLTFVETLSITVNDINEAPVLDTNPTVQLDPIAEDAFNSAGALVSSLLAGVSDVDAGALGGIAVTGVSNSGGRWQYTLDGGSTWSDFGGPTSSAVRLLAADDLTRVRFKPNANFIGGSHFWFRAWDQTQGAAGGVADLSAAGATGGATAFSSATEQAFVTVTPVNDAPVLDTSVNVQVDPVAEDATNPAGTLVSSLLAGVSDADAGALRGIAVSGVSNSGGRWQYTLDGGSTWSDFGGPTRSTARLLAADSLTRVRFKPDANFNGSSHFWFIAWDQTQGSAGGVVDLSSAGATGGTTAFSSATEQASVTATPVNDAPALSTSENVQLDPIAEDTLDSAGVLVSSLLGGMSDIDAGALRGVAVSGVSNSGGRWQYTLDGGTTWSDFGGPTRSAARLLAADDLTRVRFKPDANFHGDSHFWFIAWDQSQGAAGDVVDLSIPGTTGGTTAFSSAVEQGFITVTPVKDAPLLNTSLDIQLDPVAENSTDPAGTLVSSLLAGMSNPDGDPLRGMAVSGVANTGGRWQYTLDGGATWTDFVGPTRAAARLLAADDLTRIRFKPDADFTGSSHFWFLAWNQTQGSANDVVDLSAPGTTGGSTAFSSTVEEAFITVTSGGDAI